MVRCPGRDGSEVSGNGFAPRDPSRFLAVDRRRNPMRGRAQVSAVLAIFGLVAAVVYGCGGSSSSSTGPSSFGASGSAGDSGAVVQGQLMRGSGSAQGESVIFVVMRSALGIGIAEAAPTTPLADA